MDRIETMKYNQYVNGKITLKQLLDWHESYKQKKEKSNSKVA